MLACNLSVVVQLGTLEWEKATHFELSSRSNADDMLSLKLKKKYR